MVNSFHAEWQMVINIVQVDYTKMHHLIKEHYNMIFIMSSDNKVQDETKKDNKKLKDKIEEEKELESVEVESTGGGMGAGGGG
jgi:hypothetical protein